MLALTRRLDLFQHLLERSGRLPLKRKVKDERNERVLRPRWRKGINFLNVGMIPEQRHRIKGPLHKVAIE